MLSFLFVFQTLQQVRQKLLQSHHALLLQYNAHEQMHAKYPSKAAAAGAAAGAFGTLDYLKRQTYRLLYVLLSATVRC